VFDIVGVLAIDVGAARRDLLVDGDSLLVVHGGWVDWLSAKVERRDRVAGNTPWESTAFNGGWDQQRGSNLSPFQVELARGATDRVAVCSRLLMHGATAWRDPCVLYSGWPNERQRALIGQRGPSLAGGWRYGQHASE
jgi:hypothetical protein